MAHINNEAAKTAQYPPSPLVDPERAGVYLGGISKLTLADWRTKHFGPPFIKVGHSVRYRLVDLDAWLDSRVQKGA